MSGVSKVWEEEGVGSDCWRVGSWRGTRGIPDTCFPDLTSEGMSDSSTHSMVSFSTATRDHRLNRVNWRRAHD